MTLTLPDHGRVDILGLIVSLPDQFTAALDIFDGSRLPDLRKDFPNILFTGVGGSALAGDCARAALTDELRVPLLVNREYTLPAFAGERTLLLVSSYSGNTEETLRAYRDGRKRKARIIAITSGGELARRARKDGVPVLLIPGGLPPRCALGYSFALTVCVLSAAGLVGDKRRHLQEAARVTCRLRDEELQPGVSPEKNEAKRIAGLLAGKLCAIYGWSKYLDCAVIRWRSQIGENAKAFATSNLLPEMDHNEIMGFRHPRPVLKNTVAIFLTDKEEPQRIRQRTVLTRSIIQERVHRVIEVRSRGESRIAKIASLMYIGDFVSYYLALRNGDDPAEISEIDALKKGLARRKYSW